MKGICTAASGPRKSWPAEAEQLPSANDQIRLEGPLKELGLYTVKIHLHQEIETELKVWVVPEATDNTEAKP